MATIPALPRGVSDYVAALDLTAIAVTRDGRQLPMFAHSCAMRPLSQAAVRAPFCSTRCRVEVQKRKSGDIACSQWLSVPGWHLS